MTSPACPLAFVDDRRAPPGGSLTTLAKGKIKKRAIAKNPPRNDWVAAVKHRAKRKP
jgi:hypothetical protein